MMGNPTIVFPERGQVAVEDRPRPEVGPGQMLIQASCTLISTGTELTVLEGRVSPGSRWEKALNYPFLPGYNHVGEVVAVGEGVEDVWVGRRVASYGHHARYVTAKPEEVRVIHRAVADEAAVFFAIAEIVMNGVRRSKVTWGESAVVFGLGLLGQFTARFLHLAGARPVIGVDVAASRLALLPEGPGMIPLEAGDGVAERVERLTRGRKADLAFEVTGVASLIPDEFAVLRNQGRFVVLSSPRGRTEFDFHDLCNGPSYTIIGAHNASHPRHATPDNPWTWPRHAELFFDLLADGEMDVQPLISHRTSYQQAPDLYRMLTEDRTRAMGVVLTWDGESR